MERVEAGFRSGVKVRPIDIARMFSTKTRREVEAAAMKKELEDLRFINIQLRGVGQKKRRRLSLILGTALVEICAEKPDSVGLMVRQLLKGSTYREADRAFLHERGWL